MIDGIKTSLQKKNEKRKKKETAKIYAIVISR